MSRKTKCSLDEKLIEVIRISYEEPNLKEVF